MMDVESLVTAKVTFPAGTSTLSMLIPIIAIFISPIIILPIPSIRFESTIAAESGPLSQRETLIVVSAAKLAEPIIATTKPAATAKVVRLVTVIALILLYRGTAPRLQLMPN